MPAKKIEYEHELVRLLEEGKSPSEISRWYLETKKLDIAPGTISVFKHRRGVGHAHHERNRDLIPWVLLPQHRPRYPAKMLRLEARRRAGKELTPENQTRLDAWLEQRQMTDTVVHYDPETDQGFWYVARRPGVDDDLIRVWDANDLKRWNERNDRRKVKA